MTASLVAHNEQGQELSYEEKLIGDLWPCDGVEVCLGERGGGEAADRGTPR